MIFIGLQRLKSHNPAVNIPYARPAIIFDTTKLFGFDMLAYKRSLVNNVVKLRILGERTEKAGSSYKFFLPFSWASDRGTEKLHRTTYCTRRANYRLHVLRTIL